MCGQEQLGPHLQQDEVAAGRSGFVPQYWEGVMWGGGGEVVGEREVDIKCAQVWESRGFDGLFHG